MYILRNSFNSLHNLYYDLKQKVRMSTPTQPAKVDMKQLQNGPVENRECRDVFCLILFVINLGAMIYCSVYAYTAGNPYLLFRGTDPDKNICGVDNLASYPYVYFTNPLTLSTANRVCVTQCPSYTNGTLSNINCSVNSIVADCTYNCTVSEVGRAACTSINSTVWGYDSEAIVQRVCIPKTNAVTFFNDNNTNTTSSLGSIVSSGYLSNFISDIKNSWPVLLIGFGGAIIISFLVMLLIRWCAGCIVWLSIVSLFLFLILLGFIFCYSGGLFGDVTFQYMGFTIPKIGSDMQYIKYYGFAVWGLAGLLLIIFLCLCNRIRLAVAVCKEAGKFIADVCSVMLVPIIMAIITAGLWALCALCMVYLVSAAKFISNGGVFTSIQSYSDLALARFYYFIFATLWCNSVVQAMTIFVIASACCLWYFSHGPGESLHLPVLRSYGRAFRYHFGSLAFGSIILAFVQFLQVIVEVIKGQVEKANRGESAANKCVTCCVDCMRCCLACVERIVQFINKNAYIMIALSGKNFCAASKEGFEVVWSNPLRYAVVGGVGQIIMFLGKLMIACLTTTCVYLYITYSSGTRVMSPLLFLLLVFVYSYGVGIIFMSVYSLAMDTLLMCFIIDQTTQKQSGGKGAKNAPPQLAQLLDSQSR